MLEATTDQIRAYIKNAETEQALLTLQAFTKQHFGAEEQDEVTLIFSRFNDYRVRQRKNLIEDNTEKNQLNLDILRFCRVLEAQKPEIEFQENTLQPDGRAEETSVVLKKMEAQLHLMQRMIERLSDDAMDRFQHSRIWRKLEPLTKDHLLAAVAMERDDYLEDYSAVVLELCNALEHELRQKIFGPYRDAFKKDGRSPETELFYDHSVGQVKRQLYKFLSEEKELTFSQMTRILYDNLSERENIDRSNPHFLQLLGFIYSSFKLKNLPKITTALESISTNRFDRKAQSFVFTKEEADAFKRMTIDLLSGIQPRNLLGKIG